MQATRKRLGKDEQRLVVQRFEGYALRRRYARCRPHLSAHHVRTRRVLSMTHVVVLLCRGPPCCVLACRSANEEKARKALEDDAATAAAKTSKDKRSGWATVERLFGEGKVCS